MLLCQAYFYWPNSPADSNCTSNIKSLSYVLFSCLLLPYDMLSSLVNLFIKKKCCEFFFSSSGEDEARDELKILAGRPRETVVCTCRPDHFEASRFPPRVPPSYNRWKKVKFFILEQNTCF